MPDRKSNPEGKQVNHGCCVPSHAPENDPAPKPRWVGSKQPRIELLYFDGCPTYELVRQIVEDLLRATGGPTEIRATRVASDAQARQLKFIGSPTLRIDGRDVDPAPAAAAQYGLRCRIYAVDGKLLGYPSREMVLAALKEAGYVS